MTFHPTPAQPATLVLPVPSAVEGSGVEGADGGRARRAGLRAAGRPLRRTSRLASIDRGRCIGARPALPAIGGLGMDIGASDKASGAQPKKREKNRACPSGARPNQAGWTQTRRGGCPAPRKTTSGLGMNGEVLGFFDGSSFAEGTEPEGFASNTKALIQINNRNKATPAAGGGFEA